MNKAPVTSLDQLAHWPVRYAKGHVIYDEGDPSECMYQVERGCVRLQVNGSTGTRQIVSFLLPGDLFGFCPNVRNTAAEAVIDVTLLRYSAKAMFGDSRRALSLALSIELADVVTQSYRDLAHHVERVVHQSAEARVATFYRWLRIRLGPAGVDKPPMTQRDIADFLGLTPETLSRCVQAARREASRSESRDRRTAGGHMPHSPTPAGCGLN